MTGQTLGQGQSAFLLAAPKEAGECSLGIRFGRLLVTAARKRPAWGTAKGATDLLQAIAILYNGLVVYKALIKFVKVKGESVLGRIGLDTLGSYQTSIQNKRIGNGHSSRFGDS